MVLPTLREGLHMPFSQFWPIYLDAHRQPATRSCHYVATIFGMTTSLLAALESEILIMVGGIIGAVCMAISSHKVIERNKPLIGVNPFYGAIADVRMCWLALRGGLPAEYIRLGLMPLPVAGAVAVEAAVEEAGG
jgi:hypothetical protein